VYAEHQTAFRHDRATRMHEPAALLQRNSTALAAQLQGADAAGSNASAPGYTT
jgi:hypothetical protein